MILRVAIDIEADWPEPQADEVAEIIRQSIEFAGEFGWLFFEPSVKREEIFLA